MPVDEYTRLHAIVEGYVQGVSFRYFVTKMANGLRVTGWVRNRINGNVEVVAEGPRSALDKLLGALRQGPPSAMVTSLDHEWLPPTKEFRGFKVIPTI
jgi:acylphosphatase